MIKITENKSESKQVEVKYPCLMELIDYGALVLFHENRKGIVLKKGKSVLNVGSYHTDFSMDYFIPIYHPITLENEF